jgi:hypothetical protein
MATQYEFIIRFRNQQEPEGSGSILYQIVTTAASAVTTVRRIRDDLVRQDPLIQFDGMTLCGCEEA